MIMETQRFGEITVDDDKIILFPQGVPGFEEQHRYIILQPEESAPFSFMQSIDDGELAFIVVNPFLFFPDYQFDLPDPVQQELDIRSDADVMILSIVSVHQTSGDITLNLAAPVVLNTGRKLGKQIILNGSPYRTKHRIEFDTRQEDQSQAKDV